MISLLKIRFLRWLLPLMVLPILATYLWLAYCPSCWWSEQQPVTVMIPRGSSLRGVARILEEAGVISRRQRFVWLGILSGKSNAVSWGEYEMTTAMHPVRALSVVVSGKVKQHTILFAEGSTMQQMGALLAERGLVDSEKFLQLAQSQEALDTFGLPGPTLEGYLFPTTYLFHRSMSEIEIIGKMVRQYREVFTEAWRERAKQIKMSEKQVITLASIVEKETGIDDERARIAGVYHNRLQRKMRLQADPTVIYGIKKFDGNLTRVHLQTTTPYNTYRITGLPAGPIANPGAASIQATLFPEKHDYLYFVADGTGRHIFSKTYREHAAHVQTYQIKRRSVGRRQPSRSVKLPQS